MYLPGVLESPVYNSIVIYLYLLEPLHAICHVHSLQVHYNVFTLWLYIIIGYLNCINVYMIKSSYST